MCLAVPGKVTEISGTEGIVDFGGVKQKVRIDLIQDLKPGDYVIVHTGFAIEKLDEKDALETLELWKELAEYM
ncbi:MAG: HypC/HybG/HupF family hydrogenase formation chaperone [Theionarchaea archaeon]|nr:HypC/HybG/HupF family hydrogenase formation chaperone [Theionarchaea archaeon]MBU7001066.1 HypC/HybG/HupF family hydrogenase formation chaperone [Theionarchaea archaeon]MBU7020555.1 HypC/HybG/HupF family hydrogenase formation chaperone [Theionarchaea archaeon]MBU7034178.1 HypC/HybG/HupF family hydrogenase formation chaperone [Theionarchaea archaeon]MBU7039278.1 HypC/HybG/HupF family hydrogenase formation chaperone [Theionarchaea archaeon]